MTPQERDLISGLFERMRSMGPINKDREAESMISQAVQRTPDAAYMLVQSVLVQEQALQESGARVAELEDRVREFEQGQQRASSSGSGSFLGGLFGGSRQSEPDRRGSVPTIGSRGAPPSSYGAPPGYDAGRGGSPWGGGQAAPAPGGGGGGFMRSAMTTAAGVAGGMLAADAIRNMMGGHSGQAQAATSDATKSSSDSSPYEVKQDQPEQKQEPQYQDANDNDPGNQDVSWGDDGGGIDT